MINTKQIHKQLAEAIKLCGLTQKEIAIKLEISQQTISCYVKGTKLPALDTFANLCAVLDLDPSDILCISEFN